MNALGWPLGCIELKLWAGLEGLGRQVLGWPSGFRI